MRRALSDHLLLSEALAVVGVMLRGYANGGQQAGGSYQGALAETLTRYPRCIASYAGDVQKGVPSTTRFLPTPADIIAWAEREVAEWKAIVDRDDHEKAIREEMKQRAKDETELDAKRQIRPTLQQMKDKYGPNWGISSADKEDLVVKQARLGVMARANTAAFEAECRAAGVDPNRVASPSLERLLHGEIRMRKAERLGAHIDRVAAEAAAE